MIMRMSEQGSGSHVCVHCDRRFEVALRFVISLKHRREHSKVPGNRAVADFKPPDHNTAIRKRQQKLVNSRSSLAILHTDAYFGYSRHCAEPVPIVSKCREVVS